MALIWKPRSPISHTSEIYMERSCVGLRRPRKISKREDKSLLNTGSASRLSGKRLSALYWQMRPQISQDGSSEEPGTSFD
jgi:hypothetical protein